MLLEGNLRGVQHLGIPVADIEKAIAFYVEKFGFRLVHQPDIPTPGGVVRLAFLDRQGLVLEFYQLVGDALAEVGVRGHGHVDHFAMDVLDIDAALADALAQGVTLDPGTPEGPITLPCWPEGSRYVFLTGPHGEKIELNERLDLDRSRRPENLGGWAHLGIPVTDIKRSVEFYRQFGFKPVMETAIPVGDEAVYITMLEKEGFILEFYQLIGTDREEVGARRDGHIDHIALDVVDVDRAFAELKAAGIPPLEVAPVLLPVWENGAKYFNVRGPDGEKVEFNQCL